MAELRVVEASGRPYDLGYQVGRQCKGAIKAYLDFVMEVVLRDGETQGRSLTKDAVLRKALRFLPFFQRYCADSVEEVEGLSEGAGISFAEALLLQIRDQVLGVQEEECTTFSFSAEATEDGSTIVGQNSDMPYMYMDHLMLLVLYPEGYPGAAMVTFPGQMGYHGFNSAGIGQFANALRGTPWKMGLTHYPFKRKLLQQSTLEGCISMFKTIPLCSAGNYMIAERGGRGMDVEVVAGGDFDVVEIGKGSHVHTNHFLSRRLWPEEPPSTSGSVKRYERIKAIAEANMGRINVDTVKAMMSDHENAPSSICAHRGTGDGQTIFSIIAQPEIGVAHIAVGNPCSNPYKEYQIFRTLKPSVGSCRRGGREASSFFA